MTGYEFTAFKTEGHRVYFRNPPKYPDLTNDQQVLMVIG
jgi:hypothetical protein